MLTLYTSTSATIFSEVFSVDLFGTEKENLSIKASQVGNRFLFSDDVKMTHQYYCKEILGDCHY